MHSSAGDRLLIAATPHLVVQLLSSLVPALTLQILLVDQLSLTSIRKLP